MADGVIVATPTGNGVSDDTGAIQSCLDNATAGIVLLPAGTFSVTSLTVPNGVSIIGVGMNETIIKRRSHASSALVLLGDDASIEGVTIDGSYDTLGTGYPYSELAIGDRSEARRVKVINWADLGVALIGEAAAIRDSIIIGPGIGNTGVERGEGYFGVWSDSASAPNVEVTRCVISDCHANAIFFGDNTTGYRIADCYFADNHLMSDMIEGGQICIQGDQGIVSGCVFDGSDGGLKAYGIEIGAASDAVRIVGNMISDQGRTGIKVHTGAANIDIIGNTIRNSGTGATSAPAISISAGVSKWSVVGNRCYDDQTPKTQSHGLVISSGASDQFVVVGNDFTGNLTASISDLGTGQNRTMLGNLPSDVDTQIVGTTRMRVTSDLDPLTIERYKNESNGPILGLAHSRSDTEGTQAVMSQDDVLGQIRFYGSDGTVYRTAAMIEAQVGGTPGAADMPGSLLFYTTADGSVTPTERLRIGRSGAFLIGGAFTISHGTGTPEGAVASTVGSLFIRTDGGAGTTLYVKESGTGNTGWVPK